MLAAKGLAEQSHLARIGQQNADHHANGRSFAGAVGAKQTENLSRSNAEGKIIHRHKTVVAFAHVAEFYAVHG